MGDDLLCTPKVDPPRPHPRHTRLSVVLCCVVSRAGLFVPLDWKVWCGHRCPCKLLSALIVSKTVHTILESRIQASPALSSDLVGFPVSKWACLSMQDPRTGIPETCLLPRVRGLPLQTFSSLQSFPRAAGPNPMLFSLSCLITWRSLLLLWVYKSFSVNFQLVFHENVPHISVFLVCCAGGKLHVLLLHHLGSPPQVCFSNWIQNVSFSLEYTSLFQWQFWPEGPTDAYSRREMCPQIGFKGFLFFVSFFLFILSLGRPQFCSIFKHLINSACNLVVTPKKVGNCSECNKVGNCPEKWHFY